VPRRQRIFAASKAVDLRKIRKLQKLMVRSRASALINGLISEYRRAA
jgi:hypothetical protein